MKLVTLFTVAIATMFDAAVEGAILPVRIPLDRVYDSLSVEELSDGGLRPPPGDSGERDGYYTFETTADGDITSLVRVTNDASILTIVEEVDFQGISDHALVFVGGSNDIGVGILIATAGNRTEYTLETIARSQIKPKEWLMSNFGITVLPIHIPFGRAYDTQWNPPGHPTLLVSSLMTLVDFGNPGHYTFETDRNGNLKSFLWVTDEGAMVTIFEDIDPLLISEEVFFFNGNPNPYVPGGGYGTLIQGLGVDPAQVGGYAVETVEESNIAPREWLSDNFEYEDIATILPLNINLERAYDVQWTFYPAYPNLSVWGHRKPFFDDSGDRDGHYTFGTNVDGDIIKFVRIANDGTVVTIFERVDFVAINEEVLFFLGDGFYGTVIQAAGNSFGIDAVVDYATESVEDSAISPEGFLHLHFGIDDATSTANDLGRSTSFNALITAGTVAAVIVAFA